MHASDIFSSFKSCMFGIGLISGGDAWLHVGSCILQVVMVACLDLFSGGDGPKIVIGWTCIS